MSKQYRPTVKSEKWFQYYSDPKFVGTYGNATKSAMKAYKCKTYELAGLIGHKNIKKYKNLGRLMLDRQGVGFGELMKVGTAKMLEGSYRDWERFMEKLGYFDVKPAVEVESFDFSTIGQVIARARLDRGLRD